MISVFLIPVLLFASLDSYGSSHFALSVCNQRSITNRLGRCTGMLYLYNCINMIVSSNGSRLTKVNRYIKFRVPLVKNAGIAVTGNRCRFPDITVKLVRRYLVISLIIPTGRTLTLRSYKVSWLNAFCSVRINAVIAFYSILKYTIDESVCFFVIWLWILVSVKLTSIIFRLLVERFKSHRVLSLVCKVNLLAIPRNNLVDIILLDGNACVLFVHKGAQHIILCAGNMIGILFEIAVIHYLDGNRRIAFCRTCKKVFKNLVAEADRQSHCCRYEAAEQSLEQ